MSSDTPAQDRRGALIEVLALWLLTLVAIRAVKDVVQGAGLPELLLAAVPLLFMYAPVLACRLRGVDSWSYPLALPAFHDWPAWRDVLVYNAVLIGIVAAPWTGLYHLWTTTWLPALAGAVGVSPVPHFEYRGVWPSSMAMLVGYHLFFVAIPEEMFYRGYLQSRLDEVFPPRWRVLGAQLGPSLLITSLIFAFGHSIVVVQWWHFAIFFPSLVFGWLRSRTGGVVAGAVFHAWCNIQVTTLDTLYGVVPP